MGRIFLSLIEHFIAAHGLIQPSTWCASWYLGGRPSPPQV